LSNAIEIVGLRSELGKETGGTKPILGNR